MSGTVCAHCCPQEVPLKRRKGRRKKKGEKADSSKEPREEGTEATDSVEPKGVQQRHILYYSNVHMPHVCVNVPCEVGPVSFVVDV